MDISLTKLPWWGQIAAFVVVCAGAVFGFYQFYAADQTAEMALRQTHLIALKADIAKGNATARALPQFEGQVTDLEHRLDSLKNVLPEQKDVADTLRRIQALATQSNLTILRFTPEAPKQQPLYQEVPYRITTEGTYHNLGLFFDRVSKFPRIIDIGDIAIRALPQQQQNATIIADCTATTFVLQEAAGKGGRGGAPPVRR
ncbi:MAG TPA: type 4a pilus biogenesis protein PilO [Vicinamibacterales bacterium]